MKLSFPAALLLAAEAVAGSTSGAACTIDGHMWVANFTQRTLLQQDILVARNLTVDGSAFNISAVEMHGYGGRPALMHGDPWAGTVSGNTVKLKITAGSYFKGANFVDQECTGTFSDDCTAIDWGAEGCLRAGSGPKTPGAPKWCGAWTAGCPTQAPAYGYGMSFWDVFDDNMVLQMEPAAASVYGIATATASAVSVTVTEHTSGKSYTVQADRLGPDAVHQPVGPEFAGMHSTAAPHFAWKALLKPAAAGGNYTIFAKCSGCTATGDYSNATITNVTFGDVFHCRSDPCLSPLPPLPPTCPSSVDDYVRTFRLQRAEQYVATTFEQLQH